MEPFLLLSTPTRMMPMSTVVSSRGTFSRGFKNVIAVPPRDTETKPARIRAKHTADDILFELSLEYIILSLLLFIVYYLRQLHVQHHDY